MLSKIIKSFQVLLLLATSSAYAATSDISVESNPDIGALFPVLGQVITGEADGEDFISVANEIGEGFENGTNPTFQKVNSTIEEWSYNRGVGTIPNSCSNGYDLSGLLCYQECPSGYDTVAGVCWQQCPSGYTDHGATCTLWKWWPKTIAKHSFLQDIKGASCPSGKVNEAGLCYESCASTFVGVGPLCFGTFGGAADQQRILDQAGEQHAAALAAQTQGIVLGEDQTPVLKTDISYVPIVCAIDNTDELFGLPIPGADELASLGADAAFGQLAGAFVDSSLSGAVVMDFKFDASCEDDGVVATAGLNFHPSVTVKASTKQFDPALHALAGIDAGIMTISVYELIPFRVYGTVGTTMGVDATIESSIDRSMAPLIIDGKQHSHRTAIDITPETDFWVSAQAYLRVTSILNFIPDLVQLGSNFKLFILELDLPFTSEEGVRDTASGVEVYKKDTFGSILSAGRGSVNTFLKILGIELEVFGGKGDIEWEGVSQQETYIDSETAEPVAN